MTPMLPRQAAAEFVGTFALVFIGAGAASLVGVGAGPGGVLAVAFAHGLVVLAFASAYGAVSGAHLNPAVTLGVLVARQIGPAPAAAYVAAQLLGGVAGALALRLVLGGVVNGLGTPGLAEGLAVGPATVTIGPAAGFAVEAILAFLLLTVILNADVAKRAGRVAPIPVGMTLVLNIVMAGPLTGAAFNPARALGPMVASGGYDHLWLYVTAPLAGAVAASALFLAMLTPRESERVVGG